MEIVFCKSKWEVWNDPLEIFLQRVSHCDFSATAISLQSLKGPLEEVATLHREHGLVP